jgi:hypothetical protein
VSSSLQEIPQYEGRPLGPPPSQRRLLVRRLVILALLAACAVGFVAAFTMHKETPPVRFADRAIRTVYPPQGEYVARQSTIFIELDAASQGTIASINGHAIPEDQIDEITGLNRFSYTAGPGKEFTRFDPGRNCAVARIWPRGGTIEAGHDYQWCYYLH